MIDDEGNSQMQQDNATAHDHPVSLDDKGSNACDGTLQGDRKRKRPVPAAAAAAAVPSLSASVIVVSAAAPAEIEEENAEEFEINNLPKDDCDGTGQQNKNTDTDLQDEEIVSPEVIVNDSRQDILGKLGVPQGMIIPTTKRQYDIIQMAGTRCRTTAQFEIYLKVKQAHNPDFSFLDSKDELHPFYQWIKKGINDGDGNGNGNAVGYIKGQTRDSTGGMVGNKPAEAMGMLAMYGSSSSDDDCDDNCSDDAGERITAKAALEKEPNAREYGTEINRCNGSNHVEKIEKIGTAANNNMAAQKSGDEADAIDSKHISPQALKCMRNSSSSTSLTVEQRKAERLKRAKLLRHHFENK